MSADPVLVMASGLNVPDDLLYDSADGTVLVGEHGNGQIVKVRRNAGVVTVLPQVVPEAEGFAQLAGVTYVADQYDARVVELTNGGVKTVLQLQPVSSGENLDGISSDLPGTGLVVPDSPHGTVLFVDAAGHITSRVSGFGRPAGAWPDAAAGGYLIADEARNAVYEITGGTVTRLYGGLTGADDALREANGHVLVILPAAGRLFDASAGVDIARGLRNPQGLGFDDAKNLLVTESDSGRVDVVVRTFALALPTTTIQLAPDQGVCFGVVRAPGNADVLRLAESVGAFPAQDPLAGSTGEVIPHACAAPPCTVLIAVSGASGLEFGSFTYRD